MRNHSMGLPNPDKGSRHISRQKSRQAVRRGGRIPILVLMALLIGFSGFLVYRLYQIQINDHQVNAEQAARLHFREVTEQPRRGSIYDRNGVELAGTTYVYRIGITPADVRSITLNVSRTEIASAIARILRLEESVVLAGMAETDQTYIQLKKDVPRDQTDELREWLSANDIGGVRIDDEPRRYYTNGSLASQVIGFTNYDSSVLSGQLGVELYYNSLLTGQPGYKYVETDNYKNQGDLPFTIPTSLGARHGNNLQLNIDINIQKIVQEELGRAVNLLDITAGGSAIVLDPYTGAVLAMASYPFFDSSNPSEIPADTRLLALDSLDPTILEKKGEDYIEFLSSELWRNRPISNTYEPGSTMKAFTAAVAFEEALAGESDLFNDSPMQVLDWTISCASKVGHGIETLEQGFWRSCNPVFAQLAQRTGVSRYYSYMQAFGFFNPTGIDLPAEEAGLLHAQPTELDMATLSYGESSTLTPIQLATSFCAFANGGNLIQPSILRSVTDSDGAVIQEKQPETVRKVMSESTAARVRELLKGVVLYGTGSAAYAEGYSIGGKTSTATDDFGDYTISFAGLAPVDSPEIVVLVVLEKPSDRKASSSGAAKACGQIIARTLEYMGVAREYSELDISRLRELHAVPDVTGMTYAQAMRELSTAGLRAEAGETAMSEQAVIRQQWPAAGTEVHQRSLVFLYPTAELPQDLVAVPDFTGKTVHESLLSAHEAGLNILIDGDCLGVVIQQDPIATHLYRPGSVRPEPVVEGEDEPDNENIEDEPAIDPDTGNPVEIKPDRMQRGSLVVLRFERVTDLYEEEEEPASEEETP